MISRIIIKRLINFVPKFCFIKYDNHLLQVERIENECLYQGYLAKKKEIEETLSGTSSELERNLWYPATAVELHRINTMGFRRGLDRLLISINNTIRFYIFDFQSSDFCIVH